MLLHCKRDELRKLWIEGIEHKHVLNLLDEIENIKQVPQKLEQCMASKHYLNATDMLVRCSTLSWESTHKKHNWSAVRSSTGGSAICVFFIICYFSLLSSFFCHLLLSYTETSVLFSSSLTGRQVTVPDRVRLSPLFVLSELSVPVDFSWYWCFL